MKNGAGWNPRWHVLLLAGVLALALTVGFQAASAQRGGGSPPPPAELDYLCVNGHTGLIRDVSAPACQPHETLLTLPDDYPFLACANNYTGVLRYAGEGDAACRNYETALPMPPEEGETLLCITPHTNLLRHIGATSNCPTGGTIAGIIPAPETTDDSFAALANVPIDVPAASGVLANDTTNTGTIPAYDTASANGGVVTVNPDGSFSYTPPAGFSGIDTFGYTVTNSSGSATGTVTVDVGGPVTWFLDSAAAVNGDGTMTAPFNTLAALNADGTDPDAPGEIIYLFESATAYEGGIVLETDQVLIGQEVDLVSTAGLSVPPFAAPPLVNPSDATPTITNTSGDGITLAPGTLVAGLTVNNTIDSGVSGVDFTGDATLDRVTISQPGNGNPAVNLSTIDGTITLTNSQVTGRNGSSPGGTGIFATDVTALEIIDGTTVSGGGGQVSYNGTGTPGGVGLSGADVAVTIDAATVRGGNGGGTSFGNGGSGSVAIDLVSAELTVTNSSGINGGVGAEGWYDGGAGGTAIHGNDLTITIDASSVNGGAGGEGIFQAGGAGGPAMEVTDSTLIATGSTVTGGIGAVSWDVRGGAGATAISAQNSAVTIQGGSTITGSSGGDSTFSATGFGAPGVDADDTDLAITASTVIAGGGSPAESAVTVTNDGGSEPVAVTLTGNSLTSAASVPSLLVRTNSTTSSICLNATGNSNGAGGPPAGPFVLDNNAGTLGITQATELALSEDNFNVTVEPEGVISFNCSQG